MGNMFRAAVSHDPVPPASPAGGALLAQQIVGSWSSGPVRAVFSPDGAVTVAVLGTNRRSGRWSVGADGKLHTDLAGREAETDAGIEGDRLSISLGDSAITLTRESA
jgi:hypothetical protein